MENHPSIFPLALRVFFTRLHTFRRNAVPSRDLQFGDCSNYSHEGENGRRVNEEEPYRIGLTKQRWRGSRSKGFDFFFFFFAGTLGNAGKAPDKGLATKLRPLVKALRDSDKLVQEAATELDAMEWDAGKLGRGGGDTPTPTNGPPTILLPTVQPDPLDQLIACARALTEDVRQVASFIQVSIHSPEPRSR